MRLATADINWAAPPPELIIIRGVPGSGKSTRAKRLQERFGSNSHHWEADMFFNTSSGYKYDKSKIGEAHAWCLSRTKWSLKNGFTPVIVSNTFTRTREMIPYFNLCREFGANLTIVNMHYEYGSIHNVPEASMKKFRARWRNPIDESRLTGIEYNIYDVYEGGK
jgi:predicted ABC-type ATPase